MVHGPMLPVPSRVSVCQLPRRKSGDSFAWSGYSSTRAVAPARKAKVLVDPIREGDRPILGL